MSDKPVDWDKIYTVEVDGKTLEAIKYLAKWALQTELPPLSVIAASDCALFFQDAVRTDKPTIIKKCSFCGEQIWQIDGEWQHIKTQYGHKVIVE